MIYITHPFEDNDTGIVTRREQYASFLTAKIQSYLKDFPVLNFPLTWIHFNQEMGQEPTLKETLEKAAQFLAKADAAIVVNFPGQELCNRLSFERSTIKRLDIPMVELPFAQHRIEQLIKQDSLGSDQKRVLNLLRSNLEESQEV